MKILIVTDSHGRVDKINDIITREKPDMVTWTGDFSTDGEEISYIYPDVRFEIVRGNCDPFDLRHNDIEMFFIEKKKFLITHGHLYGVKSGLNELLKEAKKNDVNIVIYGHTHISFNEKIDGIEFFNPGALKDGKYGTLEITENKTIFNVKNI